MIRASNPAHRRYTWRVMGFMTVYVVTLVAAKYAVAARLADGPALWALAVLPALPILGVFWAMGRLLVEETDEYLRQQLVRQCLVAIAFALSIATVWGFLENFGLVPHADAYWAAILFFAGLGVGGCFNLLSRPRLEEEA